MTRKNTPVPTIVCYESEKKAGENAARRESILLLRERLRCPERAPSRQSEIGGVKGHNINEISFAHILFATDVPGKPRPVGGELHFFTDPVRTLKDHLSLARGDSKIFFRH